MEAAGGWGLGLYSRIERNVYVVAHNEAPNEHYVYISAFSGTYKHVVSVRICRHEAAVQEYVTRLIVCQRDMDLSSSFEEED